MSNNKIKDVYESINNIGLFTEKQTLDLFMTGVASRLVDNETIINTLANETKDLFEESPFNEDDFEFLITFKQK
jgi:hypothetical protein